MEYLPAAKRILEPFAGSGTTPIVLGQSGIECAFAEANPTMEFVIATKLKILGMGRCDRQLLSSKTAALAAQLTDRARSAPADASLGSAYGAAFGASVFFDAANFAFVLRLRSLCDEIDEVDPLLGSCLTLAVLASLIPASRMKRAGDLRFKTPKELSLGTPCILALVKDRLLGQALDMVTSAELRSPATFACSTASELRDSVQGTWDGVITSPPYLNGTNYIRNARLELWYQRLLKSKADLRRLRDGVITSGINDVDAQTDWRPVTSGVERVVAELEKNTYDQRIPKMVGGYFRDMHRSFSVLVECLNAGGRMCVDIGDSIYAGVHVPTDDLLVEVAEGLGLRTLERIHLRKRTSKGGQPVRQQLLVFEK